MTTVYLVDDEAVVRDALAFLLGSRGLTVQPFDSGPALLAALEALRAQHQPVRGVFVLDVRMAPMSGLQLHEALLASDPDDGCVASLRAWLHDTP